MKTILLLSTFVSQFVFAATQSDSCKRKEALYAEFQRYEARVARAEGTNTNVDEELKQMKRLSEAYKKADLRCKE